MNTTTDRKKGGKEKIERRFQAVEGGGGESEEKTLSTTTRVTYTHAHTTTAAAAAACTLGGRVSHAQVRGCTLLSKQGGEAPRQAVAAAARALPLDSPHHALAPGPAACAGGAVSSGANAPRAARALARR